MNAIGIKVADLNGDKQPEILYTRGNANPGDVLVYWNLGKRKFSKPQHLTIEFQSGDKTKDGSDRAIDVAEQPMWRLSLVVAIGTRRQTDLSGAHGRVHRQDRTVDEGPS